MACQALNAPAERCDGTVQMEMDDMEKPAEQRTRFSFKCSFLELYNETITDLLRPSSVNLQVRPAAVSVAFGKRGVRREGASCSCSICLLGRDGRAGRSPTRGGRRRQALPGLW
jgi:hypothetical protein